MYVEVTKDELMALRTGLDIIERVRRENGDEWLELYLYGLTSNTAVLAAVREAVANESEGLDEEISEENVNVKEVAIAIALGSDPLYYLTGSGLILRDQSFTFNGEGGEGVRESSLRYGRSEVHVTIHDFTEMAIADNDMYLDKFLTQHGSKVLAPKPEVKRDEEATVPPANPQEIQNLTSQQGTPNKAPTLPKTTHKTNALTLSDILDGYLGN
jgi:hypothetical protein